MNKKKYIMLFFIFSTFFHTVLRTGMYSKLSFPRILFPLIGFYLFLFYFKQTIKVYVVFIIFITYNLMVSIIYGSTKYLFQYSLHYFFLFSIYLVVCYLMESGVKRKIFNLIINITIFLVPLTILEKKLNFVWPNTANGDYGIEAGAFFGIIMN